MSFPCCICGKTALYHVGKSNFCGKHKEEAWASRKRANAIVVCPELHELITPTTERSMRWMMRKVNKQRREYLSKGNETKP